LRERLGERGINISSKFIARKFRSNFTDAELKLLSALKNRQLQNFKFRRQASIGKYIVDFVCLEKSLITEVDGGQYMEASLADDERTAWLQSQGCLVIRFWNDQVLKETDAVLEETLRCLSQGNQR
jgi:very-short-patch-repair endonuclease